jgi:hypothetical protein
MHKVKVHISLLAEAMIVRGQVADLAAEMDDLNADAVQGMFKNKSMLLRTIDKFVVIEEAFFLGMAGDVGREKFKIALLECLPTAQRDMTWTQSRGKLEALADSCFAKFTGRGLLGQLQTVILWVKAGEGSRQVKMKLVTSEYLQKARDAMAFFYTYDGKTGKAPKKGKVGVDELFKDVSKYMEADVAVPLTTLKPLVIYQWLLTAAQQQKVTSWMDGALASVKIAPAVVKVEASKKKRLSSKVGDSTEKLVLDSYFAKSK